MGEPSTTPRPPAGRERLLGLITAALTASAIGVLGFGYWYFFALPSGLELNQRAFEASYTERGLSVPENGPREGFWGNLLPKPIRDPKLGWFLSPFYVRDLVHVDDRGYQHYRPGRGASAKVAVVGGSVAFGAYASRIDTTYFARAADRLAERGLPVAVTVLATGAWYSEHELAAVRDRIDELAPDVLVMVNGLNDLTIHRAIPLDERAAFFLDRMREVLDEAGSRGADVLFTLQPYLPDKRHKTRLERRVLALSIDQEVVRDPHMSERALKASFESLRRGLRELAAEDAAYFEDCSGVTNDERATTFADLWHFSDPAHDLLGACIAHALEPILLGRTRATR